MNGILLVDKPLDITSFKVCDLIKKKFNLKKIGHSGTLDPSASGLLVIGLNESTRFLRFLQKGGKTYRFSIRWGLLTDSWDLEGKVIEEKDCRPSHEDIADACSSFKGTMKLPVPYFSSKKVKGRRLYEYARKSDYRDFEKEMLIESLRYDASSGMFEIDCGEGTYVRSVALVLGRMLSCPATLSTLVRLKNNGFLLEDAVPLNKILLLNELNDIISDIKTALSHLEAFEITAADYQALMSGAPMNLNLPSPEKPIRLFFKGRNVAVFDGSGEKKTIIIPGT